MCGGAAWSWMGPIGPPVCAQPPIMSAVAIGVGAAEAEPWALPHRVSPRGGYSRGYSTVLAGAPRVSIYRERDHEDEVADGGAALLEPRVSRDDRSWRISHHRRPRRGADRSRMPTSHAHGAARTKYRKRHRRSETWNTAQRKRTHARGRFPAPPRQRMRQRRDHTTSRPRHWAGRSASQRACFAVISVAAHSGWGTAGLSTHTYRVWSRRTRSLPGRCAAGLQCGSAAVQRSRGRCG